MRDRLCAILGLGVAVGVAVLRPVAVPDRPTDVLALFLGFVGDKPNLGRARGMTTSHIETRCFFLGGQDLLGEWEVADEAMVIGLELLRADGRGGSTDGLSARAMGAREVDFRLVRLGRDTAGSDDAAPLTGDLSAGERCAGVLVMDSEMIRLVGEALSDECCLSGLRPGSFVVPAEAAFAGETVLDGPASAFMTGDC